MGLPFSSVPCMYRTPLDLNFPVAAPIRLCASLFLSLSFILRRSLTFFSPSFVFSCSAFFIRESMKLSLSSGACSLIRLKFSHDVFTSFLHSVNVTFVLNVCVVLYLFFKLRSHFPLIGFPLSSFFSISFHIANVPIASFTSGENSISFGCNFLHPLSALSTALSNC